jgi:hypothetical protein
MTQRGSAPDSIFTWYPQLTVIFSSLCVPTDRTKLCACRRTSTLNDIVDGNHSQTNSLNMSRPKYNDWCTRQSRRSPLKQGLLLSFHMLWCQLFVFFYVCGGSALFRYARDSFETVGRGSMVLNFDWRHQNHDKPVSDVCFCQHFLLWFYILGWCSNTGDLRPAIIYGGVLIDVPPTVCILVEYPPIPSRSVVYLSAV